MGFKISIELFGEILEEANNAGYKDILICPEVLGKRNQLGSLDEIIEICKAHKGLMPTVDFGHIHARNQGSLNSAEDFERVILKLEHSLGYERIKTFIAISAALSLPRVGRKSIGELTMCNLAQNLNTWLKSSVKRKWSR